MDLPYMDTIHVSMYGKWYTYVSMYVYIYLIYYIIIFLLVFVDL